MRSSSDLHCITFFMHSKEFAGNQGKRQNFDPSILQYKFGLIFKKIKQKKNIFFCFILMKISPNLYGRMDGSKFWCFPWFPEKSLLCVILCYTVYIDQTLFILILTVFLHTSFYKQIFFRLSDIFKVIFKFFFFFALPNQPNQPNSGTISTFLHENDCFLPKIFQIKLLKNWQITDIHMFSR